MGLLDGLTMGVPGELFPIATNSPPARPGAPLPRSIYSRAMGLRGVSSFDEGPLVKVRGIPRPTGRSPVNPDICYKLRIPVGSRGTTATLEKMADMAVEASQDPGFVQEARGIVRDCPERDLVCEGKSFYEEVRRSVKYVNDPIYMEYVQSPGMTYLIDGQGDCDDQSTLISAFDLSVGRGCRYGAYMLDEEKARDGEFSHVLCEMGIRTPAGEVKWLGQDTVARRGFGWTPPERIWHGEPNYLVIANP